MTTIAWNDQVIAWDSQSTSGSDIKHIISDKVRFDTDRFYILAGTAHLFDALIAWEKAGCVRDDFPEYPDSNPNFFVFTATERMLYLHGYKAPVPPTRNTAGSGGDLAMAAMRAGADPIRAVEIAADMDVYSSLPVHSLRFDAYFTPAPNVRRLSITTRK